MKKQEYVIIESETGYSYDPIEDKFYPPNWEYESIDDLLYLETIMEKDTERFAGCKIITL